MIPSKPRDRPRAAWPTSASTMSGASSSLCGYSRNETDPRNSTCCTSDLQPSPPPSCLLRSYSPWSGGAGERHGDREPAGGSGGDGERPVVGPGDGLDDGQAQADPGVVADGALGAALERLGERRDQHRGEHLAGVLDGEHGGPVPGGGGDPHRAVLGQVV